MNATDPGTGQPDLSSETGAADVIDLDCTAGLVASIWL